jgi:hypothetical protein
MKVVTTFQTGNGKLTIAHFDERIVHDNDFYCGLEISHLERELLSQHI